MTNVIGWFRKLFGIGGSVPPPALAPWPEPRPRAYVHLSPSAGDIQYAARADALEAATKAARAAALNNMAAANRKMNVRAEAKVAYHQAYRAAIEAYEQADQAAKEFSDGLR